MRIVFCLLVFFTSSFGVDAAYAKDGSIKIAYISWRMHPPYSWENNTTGQLEGFEIALLESLMDKLGLKYQWVILEGDKSEQLHDRAMAGLATGEFDLYTFLPGQPVSSEFIRLEFPAYFKTVKAYTLRARDIRINALDDLKQLRFGSLAYATTSEKASTQTSGQAENRFWSDLEQTNSIKTYKDYAVLITAMLKGDIDFTLASTGSLSVFARLMNVQEQLDVHDLPASTAVPVYYVISANSDLLEYQDQLSKTLSDFRQQGRTRLLFESAMKKFIDYYLQAETHNNKISTN